MSFQKFHLGLLMVICSILACGEPIETFDNEPTEDGFTSNITGMAAEELEPLPESCVGTSEGNGCALVGITATTDLAEDFGGVMTGDVYWALYRKANITLTCPKGDAVQQGGPLEPTNQSGTNLVDLAIVDLAPGDYVVLAFHDHLGTFDPVDPVPYVGAAATTPLNQPVISIDKNQAAEATSSLDATVWPGFTCD